ncbi:glycosyltransferase family A protein [Mariniflexile litorale]|uniref:Glycosyltransferase family A protein n=1 Tax=Mariniflexile litorale TaxID=3045158 RepID=A0AAU7EC75_9FLAO|nr:glycosyltransferase family A protein [Mariniflexile sp. KMM 9835]MDQ8212216.1 glycosyltransferase family A protein [Mariniflexile sp. KMM 9835]
MSVLVSIIVPCYNQAHYLSEALQSVLEQTYINWECIIVNDGSPDNTEHIAKQWLEKDARFKYVYQENGGLPSARNFGIKKSLGVLILPLDADDILHPDYLKKTVPVLNKNSDLGIVSCYRYFFTGNKSNIIKEYKASGSNYLDLMFENKLMPSSIYRRTCWEEVGGYDETMKKGFEDWEFWLNVTKRGWKFQFVEAFLFYYRKAKKSMLVDTINNHSEANIEYIFRKHKELYTKHFDNTAEVLFYYIKTHRLGKMKIKNSLEYKIGKGVMKPFRIVYKLLSQANKKE